MSSASHLGPLDFVAAAAYLGVAVAAVRGSLRSVSATPRYAMATVAGAFAGLAGWRLVDMENLIRDTFHAYAMGHGTYGERASLQRPVLLLMLIALAAAALGLTYATRGLPRWHRRALAFASALIGYTLVRSLSFHPVDQIIYSGGLLRLNYLIDAGLTFATLLCCILAARGPQPGVRRR